MKQMKKRYLLTVTILVCCMAIIFLPAPTAETAVRKELFFSLHPIKAISSSVQEGIIKNDPEYGDLYIVEDVDTSAIYLKKYPLGWLVTSRGTGP